MTKSIKKEEIKDDKPDLELHPEMSDLAQLYMGDKVSFSMKGLNEYEVDAKNLVPTISGINFKAKRPSMKYKILIKDTKAARIYQVKLGTALIYKEEVDKKAKFKKAPETLLKAVVKHVTERIKNYWQDGHKEIAQEFSKLADIGEIEGTYDSIPDTAYHMCVGVSKSQLNYLMSKTYAHLKHMQENGGKDTAAMTFGRAFHSKVLTPEEYYKEVGIAPDIPKTDNAGKIAHALFEMENAYKTIISSAQHIQIEKMEKKLKQHPVIGPILKEALTEVAFFWNNESDTLSRGKMDGIIANPSAKLKKLLAKYLDGYKGESIIFDVKTDENAEEEAFSKKLFNYNYHVQGAYYLSAAKKMFPDLEFIFMFLVVEKSGPCEAAYYALNAPSIELGEGQYRETLEEHKLHEENPEMWHGYSLKGSWISVPQWAYKRY